MSTGDQDYQTGMQVGSVTIGPSDGSISWPGPYNVAPTNGAWVIVDGSRVLIFKDELHALRYFEKDRRGSVRWVPYGTELSVQQGSEDA